MRVLIVLALVAGDATGILAEERIHSLQAEQVLPTGQLEGPNYRIEPQVLNDGLVNTYRLDTKYGPLTVEGTPLLLERLGELRALDRIEKVESSEVYKTALKEGAKSPLKGAGALIDDPVATVKGAAQGIGRWMSDIGRSISSKDPHQAGVAQTALGQAAAKRAFAYDFGIDPYTRFKPLQKSLDDLGWAMAGGGLTTKVAFSLIPGASGIVVSATGVTSSMKALVRDKSPAQLDTINRAELLKMGVSATVIDAFLGNSTFSPQDKTIIVGELASLKGVRGRSDFISSAALVDSLSLATFMRYRAQMIGRYQNEVGGIESFVKIEKTLFLKTKRGDCVGLFPIDRIAYDAEMVEKLKVLEQAIAKQPGVRSKQLWIGGPVEPEALAVLKQRGWTVHDRQYSITICENCKEIPLRSSCLLPNHTAPHI
jgi:hypothetical protein